MDFKIISDYQPTGDQPKAIEELQKGVEDGEQDQVLLGVTGSGKTFTIANLIERVQKPTLCYPSKHLPLLLILYLKFR